MAIESTAHALIRAAFRETETLLNLSALARTVGVSPQRLGGYWRGEHPWPADVALAVLAASGRLKRGATGLVYEGDIPEALDQIVGAVDGTVPDAPRRKRRRTN